MSFLYQLRHALEHRFLTADSTSDCFQYLASSDEYCVHITGKIADIQYRGVSSDGNSLWTIFVESSGKGAMGILEHLIQSYALNQIVTQELSLDQINSGRIYIFAFAILTICIGAYPVLNIFARRSTKVDALVWAIIVLQLMSNLATAMASSAVRLYIVSSSPRPSALSSTNSLGQMVATLSRALAPLVASTLFALSLEWNLAGGYMVYILLLAVVAGGTYCSLLLSSDPYLNQCIR
ncbi:hypothetical protein B0H17DRAFT_1204687 [Mycena rosella]|uniref:Major facilitator superfamily (MFS) profile domain-containing protein n=1 Tax=Mycena rosella TaxID=1033263 RepID=A0AAD7D8L9_MYCRO|nr:hypothetical protein B0H17DRAFT_1204687 [Mycena rosella]